MSPPHRSPSPVGPALVAAALAFGLAACRQDPVDAHPANVVEAFVERMLTVHGDPARAKLALALLSKEARQNLEERARRASAASGRPIQPEEMLAPSRFSLAFDPVEYRAEIRGKWSRVFITGPNPQQDSAEVRCYLEDEGWRVVLDLPPLAPIQKRD